LAVFSKAKTVSAAEQAGNMYGVFFNAHVACAVAFGAGSFIVFVTVALYHIVVSFSIAKLNFPALTRGNVIRAAVAQVFCCCLCLLFKPF
jgi:hypothetical protein